MAIQYDKCPGCGATVIKGAMRCTSCGANLISAEEKEERIKRYKESQKKSPLGAVIKFVLFLIVAGALWYYFYDEIMVFVRGLLNRFGK
jgi:uncharacterized membrane protein YvbJ